MKTKSVLFFSYVALCFLSLSSFKSIDNNQNEVVLNAIYDGHEDYGYNFLYLDKEGEERTITFQKVEESILSDFDLKSEALVKTKFKLTYKIAINKSKDEYGNEDEDEIYTLLKLQTL